MLFRKNKLATLSILGLLSTLPFSVHAESTQEPYIIVAPQCLTKHITAKYETLSTLDKLSLIKVNETGLNQLIAAKDHQKQLCGGFINVSDAWRDDHQDKKAFLSRYMPNKTTLTKKSATEYAINHPQEVNQLVAALNPEEMWGYLKTLSSFSDRYAGSDTGVQAANWIKSQVEKMAKDAGRTDVTAYLINTGSSYKQPSVVVKVGTSTEPGIVIGGHMDTLSAFFGNMPGADDDGSGTVTVMEAARTILSSNMHFHKPIYFIWYSAEEMGLVGSQHVVAEFKKQNIAVDNVIHFDMTGYAANNDPTMWLISDNTNKDLTTYLGTLITTYVKQPIKYTACGYACSDHATWTSNGYKAAIAFEAQYEKYNPYIHSSQDTMDLVSLTHMTDYAKLAVAFAVELAEPVK